jgi:hypothetical protein
VPHPKNFIVGIVGHRPNRLPISARDAVVKDIGDVLDTVKAAAPDLTLVLATALAEGADRIAAHVALARGFALKAILPLSAEAYEKDFADDASRQEFAALLAAGTQITVQLGTLGARYEAAGIRLLEESNLLIAVWDGGPSGGPGGTTAMIERAAQTGVPTILVDALGERHPRASGMGGMAQCIADAVLASRGAIL